MIDDEKSLNQIEKTVSGRKILLLAPGSSLKAYPDKIRSFIEKEQPLVISVNFESSDFLSLIHIYGAVWLDSGGDRKRFKRK